MGFIGVKFIYIITDMSPSNFNVANSCPTNIIRENTFDVMNFTFVRKIFVENVDLLLKF